LLSPYIVSWLAVDEDKFLGAYRVTTWASGIDYSGARGSNAGDEFHELWALQQVLDLLQPGTDLTAVSVEGVRTSAPTQDADAPTWDSVDCALYFGGKTLEIADRVELAQLKYSAANPEQNWSVADLTRSTAKTKNNSIVRKLAAAFGSARARMKPGADLRVRFLSNQGIASDLEEVLRLLFSADEEEINENAVANLAKLQHSTGLSKTDFRSFMEVMDFSGCSSPSRLGIWTLAVSTVADMTDDCVLSEVRELRTQVRKLMTPENARQIITEKDVLAWLGLASRKGLFPCPPEIRDPERIIGRAAARDVVKHLQAGERLLLVHGVGGCGKTTLLRQIGDYLPEQSVTVFFDCFGGGRYLYPEDRRHLAENAFLQMANDLATELRLPLFIPRSSRSLASVRMFLSRLRLAAQALDQRNPDALAVIVVDAADNAVAAAGCDNGESPFVFDLLGVNLDDLPANVRIVASCRTGRTSSLRLPPGTPKIECPLFSQEESREHLTTAFRDPDDDLVKRFHTLSHENARVQAYAIAAAGGDQGRLLHELLPGGKTLPDVFRQRLERAEKKLGQPQSFKKLVGMLACLSPPISVPTMARIADCPVESVCDLERDLWPALRIHDGAVTVSDEDFEFFIKYEMAIMRAEVLAGIAEDFFQTLETDPYSAAHVADVLAEIGRAEDVITVIDRDPQVSAVDDPIRRRQIQLRRLRLALAACTETTSHVDALKTILISAEAERDDRRLHRLLEENPDLSADFAGASLRRTLLIDRDRIKKRGSFLAQDAAQASRSGDRTAAREQLQFYNSWLKRRQHLSDEEKREWLVDDGDVAARVEAILRLDGATVAFQDLRHWTPLNIAVRVALILVPQFIAAGETHLVEIFLEQCGIPKPWDLLLRVPLAMAGRPIDGLELEESLRRFRVRLVPARFEVSGNEAKWQGELLTTFITACEISFALSLDSQTTLVALDRLLKALEGTPRRRLFDSEARRLDGLLRCWLLRSRILGAPAKADEFVEFTQSLDPGNSRKPRSDKHKRDRSPRRQASSDDNLAEAIRALFPLYKARLEILSSAAAGKSITDQQLARLSIGEMDRYHLDYRYTGRYLREAAAQSVMSLLSISSIKASVLAERAERISTGRLADAVFIRRRRVWRWLRLRRSAASDLVEFVANAATSIKEFRTASSEKAEALVGLARLIRPISQDDARALFNNAVEIAQNIDEEALDQIAFVSVLAAQAADFPQQDWREAAIDVSAFISGAAERLTDYDGFPWRSAASALACLDPEVALSSICRWADNGTCKLDLTLAPFLTMALRRNVFSAEVVASLSLLIEDYSSDVLRSELVAHATRSSNPEAPAIDELAKDVLLLLPQHMRLSAGKQIIEQLPRSNAPGSSWTKLLKQTVDFRARRAAYDSDEAAAQHEDETLLSATQRVSSDAFEFDPQEGAFATPDSILRVLQGARHSGLRFSEREILDKMQRASATPSNRIPFLNAVAEIPSDLVGGLIRLGTIYQALTEWNSPAIDQWRKNKLPAVLVENFEAATVWLKEGQGLLEKLLDLCEVTGNERIQIILRGVARAAESLRSQTQFAIAEVLVQMLGETDAGELLVWYVTRLRNRLPSDDHLTQRIDQIPQNTSEAIARFLFALMSDIDKRMRWRAAHALRRLARLGCSQLVLATVSQADRVEDGEFRDPSAPFYFLAARQWLTASLYRISVESPESLSLCKNGILSLATSSELPHVAIREHAKRALLEMHAAGAISLTPSERSQVTGVNAAAKGITTKDRDFGRSFDLSSSQNRGFSFDTMDTLPYWYERLLRVFPTATPEHILDLAERWIVDEWGAREKAHHWDREPRKARYDERQYGLWSHYHGSVPTVERYGTHLEWHAMHCVVGELLLTHCVSEGEADGWGSYAHWLSGVLPTDPPEWISDLRSATPLEARLWDIDKRTDNGWVHNTRRSEFSVEIGIRNSLRKGWIVVAGEYDTYSKGREATVRISSALVSPETAPALMRALQTASDPWDFHIPSDAENPSIDAAPYNLSGWIARIEGDLCFDEHDPFRYEVRRMQARPGVMVTARLGLVPRAGDPCTWIGSDNGEPVMIYETWSDEPPPERDRYLHGIRSSGWRLWAKAAAVQSLLVSEKHDLVCEVQIERRLRSEYGRSYEPNAKRKLHERILLLRIDGSVVDIKGRVGAWASSRQ